MIPSYLAISSSEVQGFLGGLDGGPPAGMAMERCCRAVTGARTGIQRPEEFPAYGPRTVPGGVGRRRAAPARRRLRRGRPAARIQRAASGADGLLRSRRVQRAALGGGGGHRAARDCGPVARGPVADGPGPHAGSRATTGTARASPGTSTNARRDADARDLARADAHAGSAAHAAGPAHDRDGPALDVAAPGTAAVAFGGRGLVSPLVTLVGGLALSPATLVVTKAVDTTVAQRPASPGRGPEPRWLCWSGIIRDAAVKEETWRASSC